MLLISLSSKIGLFNPLKVFHHIYQNYLLHLLPPRFILIFGKISFMASTVFIISSSLLNDEKLNLIAPSIISGLIPIALSTWLKTCFLEEQAAPVDTNMFFVSKWCKSTSARTLGKQHSKYKVMILREILSPHPQPLFSAYPKACF